MTLALILLVLVALLIIAVVAGGGESVELDVFGVEVGATGTGLFLTGLVAGVVITLAAVLLRLGMRKGMRQRQKMRDLEHRARDVEATRPATSATPEPDTAPQTSEPEPAIDERGRANAADKPEDSESR